MTRPESRRWRFACVEFDERDLSLLIEGRVADIEPKPLRILRHLLERSGSVVTKDELIRAVWPGRIVTDAALAKNIARLREAIGDRDQSVVRTHHGYGYRLAATVSVELTDGAAAPAQAPPECNATRDAAPEQNKPQAEAEHRPLTVLFCDLVDSSALAATLDAETYRERLIGYHARAADLCRRYEGHVAQKVGDGLLMYFGYPAAHDDDAERALRCACALISEFCSGSETEGSSAQASWQPSRGRAAPTESTTRRSGFAANGSSAEFSEQLGLRIGVHSATVLIGEMQGELLATGSGLHISSRLQALAEPDSILASDATFRRVPGLFVTRDFGPIELRGVPEPVRVHQVLQPSGVRTRLEAASTLTPFVGRYDERARIDTLWRAAVDGRGAAALICGEPGIGKSRLLLMAREQLAGYAYTWLECRAFALSRHSAYQPLLELLVQGLSLRDADNAEQKLLGLEQSLQRLALDSADTVPLLAPLLDLPLPARYPTVQLGAALRHRRTQEALVSWALALSRQQPLVVAFEDLHWADEGSLACLGLLLERMADMPILLLTTARPEFVPRWPKQHTPLVLSLDPLPGAQVQTMLDALSPALPLSPAVSALVLERAGGVPLFVEELARDLLDSGRLRERDGVLELDPAAALSAIPVTLHSLLLARLDRLGPARELIQLAAVIGREVPHRLLALVAGLEEGESAQFGRGIAAATTAAARRSGYAATGTRADLPDPELRAQLDVLIASGQLYARGTGTQTDYVFKHAMIQDAAYDRLAKSRRQALHGRVARALQDHFPELAGTEPERLALHFERAGQDALAARWYGRAASRAIHGNAYAEAIRHGEQGLLGLASCPEGSARDREELELLVTVGAARIVLLGRGHPDLDPIVTRSSQLCASVSDVELVARALANLAQMHYGVANYRAAVEVGEQFLAFHRRTGIARYACTGHAVIALSSLFLGEIERSDVHASRAIAECDDTAARETAQFIGIDGLTAVLSTNAMVQCLLGNPVLSLQRAEQGVARAEAIGHHHSVAVARTRRVWPCIWLRLNERAAALAEDAAAYSERHGFGEYHEFALVQRGFAIGMLGRVEEGLALLREMRARRRRNRALYVESYHAALEAELWLAADKPEQASAALDEAEDYAQRFEERFWRPEFHRLRGGLALKRGARLAADAEGLFIKAIRLARAQGSPLLELRAALDLVRILKTLGRAAEAVEVLSASCARFTPGADTADLRAAAELSVL